MLNQLWKGVAVCAGLLIGTIVYANDAAPPIALQAAGIRLLPLAACSACLGATVTTDGATGVSTVVLGDRTVTFIPNNAQVTIGNRTLACPTPPISYNGVLYVPDVALIEGLGASLWWHGDRQVVSVLPKDGKELFCPAVGRVLFTTADVDGDGTREMAYAIASDPAVDEAAEALAGNVQLWVTKGAQTVWQTTIGAPDDTVTVDQIVARDLTGDRRPELIIATQATGAYTGSTEVRIYQWTGATFRQLIANDTGCLELPASGGAGDVLVQDGKPGTASRLLAYATTDFRQPRSPITIATYTLNGTQFTRTAWTQTRQAYDYHDEKDIAKALKELAVTGTPLLPRTGQGLAIKGSTMVPLRFLAEWLGATVTFDAAARRITLLTPTSTLRLTLDSTQAFIGDNPVTLQAPAVERKGTTYVPLRFVAEGFRADVAWNAARQQAVITHPTSGGVVTITVVPETVPTPRVNTQQLLSSLRQQAHARLCGTDSRIGYAVIKQHNGSYYGIVRADAKGPEMDLMAFATVFRYSPNSQQWAPAPVSLDEESGYEFPDTAKASTVWGVPAATLDGWIRAAYKR